MNEIEIKILEIDTEKVQERLWELGAKKIFDGELTAQYFNIDTGGVLRVRKEGEEVILCHKTKAKLTAVRSAEETQVSVGDYDTTILLLEQLGYTKRIHTHKRRISYQLGKARIDIDLFTNKKIPPFLEVEAPTEEIINKTVQALGFESKDMKNWTQWKLFSFYDAY